MTFQSFSLPPKENTVATRNKQTKTDAEMKKSGNSKSRIKTKAVGIWALVQKVMGGVMSYFLNLH